MYVPENYDWYRTKEAEEEKWLQNRPRCENCGEHIQDEYLYDVDGAVLCEECMKDLFRQSTEDYERSM